MPVDRAATLKNAEKLLRQGKVEAAISEYVRLVADQPQDWNTANVLGDLYVRAGQIDKAVEQFTRIADSLSDEGFLPKAGALYKKVLKIKPDHEHALVQGAEIAASQGLLADARAYLNTVIERRRARGDRRGAAQARIRLASVDAGDLDARLNGARARVELSDTAGALRDFRDIAAELFEKGRSAEAIEALREAAAVAPDDADIRDSLQEAYLAAGDVDRARDSAVTAAHFKAIARTLETLQRPDEALEALSSAARLDPEDTELKAHLARAFVARNDMAAAAEYLTAESAGADAALLVTAAEIRLRAGQVDEGLGILARLLEDEPARRDEVAMLGCALAADAPDLGFRVVDVAAASGVRYGDWTGAAAHLQQFVTEARAHVPALLRLVEVCVDGGLDALMYGAQGQLADAYLETGSAAEARFIAEDLVAREPLDRANIERLRRALELLGEPDPDAIIDDRLSSRAAFTSTDTALADGNDLPDHPAPADEPEPVPILAGAGLRLVEPPAPMENTPDSLTPALSPMNDSGGVFALGANAIDFASLFEDLDGGARRPAADATAPQVEIDLSDELQHLERAPAPVPAVAPVPEAPDVESLFAQMRHEASTRTVDAQELYARGMALAQAGQLDEAAEALREAARTPALRFRAASALAEICRSRSQMTQAIEWYERAAQAPAPTVEEGYGLLYELANALESVGELARALAICMEVRAEAGEYRDLTQRIDRLARAQTQD